MCWEKDVVECEHKASHNSVSKTHYTNKCGWKYCLFSVYKDIYLTVTQLIRWMKTFTKHTGKRNTYLQHCKWETMTCPGFTAQLVKWKDQFKSNHPLTFISYQVWRHVAAGIYPKKLFPIVNFLKTTILLFHFMDTGLYEGNNSIRMTTDHIVLHFLRQL